jgi:protein disulfide-isomerase A6
LNDKAGRVDQLDDLASQFFLAAADARKKIYEEAVTVAESAGSYGQHYLKVMQKVVNSSDEYLTKETTR